VNGVVLYHKVGFRGAGAASRPDNGWNRNPSQVQRFRRWSCANQL